MHYGRIHLHHTSLMAISEALQMIGCLLHRMTITIIQAKAICLVSFCVQHHPSRTIAWDISALNQWKQNCACMWQ